MSLQSWKDRYYPLAAVSAATEGAMAAVEHGLLKWHGLREATLREHGLIRSQREILDDDENSLFIDANSCALCVRYIAAFCAGCPLADARNGIPCDQMRAGESKSPYFAYVRDGDPEPMIEALEAAKELLIKEG